MKWGYGHAKTWLSYSFPWADQTTAYFYGYLGADYSAQNEHQAEQRFALDANQQNAFELALSAWADVANIGFFEQREVNAVAVGDIRVAFSSAVDTNSWGWTWLPDGTWPSGGDIWINPDIADSPDWAPNSYNYLSLMHELGHALGLRHPNHDPYSLSMQTTIMSYNDITRNAYYFRLPDGSLDFELVYPSTPMLYDIASIQYTYGANLSYHTGDDVYKFEAGKPFFRTLWDAGGNDTISTAGFSQNQVIDLAQGAYSSIFTVDPEPIAEASAWSATLEAYAYTGENNLAIAFGAIIENAIGGLGNDIIRGNASNNQLSGGAGDDRLYGLAGNDELDGGLGDDVLDGGEGLDVARYGGRAAQFTVATSAGALTVSSSADGRDHLTNMERLHFSDLGLAFDFQGHAGITARILGAVFGPESVTHTNYVAIGLALLDGGMSTEQLTNLALLTRMGPAPSPELLVSTLYENLFGAAPSATTRQAFVDLIEAGVYSNTSMAVLALQTDLNAQNIDLVGLSHTGIAFDLSLA